MILGVAIDSDRRKRSTTSPKWERFHDTNPNLKAKNPMLLYIQWVHWLCSIIMILGVAIDSDWRKRSTTSPKWERFQDINSNLKAKNPMLYIQWVHFQLLITSARTCQFFKTVHFFFSVHFIFLIHHYWNIYFRLWSWEFSAGFQAVVEVISSLFLQTMKGWKQYLLLRKMQQEEHIKLK